MESEKGVKVLKATGTALVAWSVLEIVIEILNVMKFDLASFGSILGDLFIFQAGNAAVPILLSIVGLAAGAAALFLAEDDRFNKWLRYFGMALIVIYVVEGILLMGANPGIFSWIRLAIVLVFACFYFYGAWLLQKEDRQFAHQH